MNDYIVSLIRTWVPVALGGVLSWAIEAGVEIDRDGAIIAVTGVIISIYYAVVRFAETKYPQIGVLLGKRTAPKYEA